MLHPDSTYCPFCTGEILDAAFLCKNCGRDLHAIRIAYAKTKALPKADYYHIVADGSKFGIALGTEVVLHGLDIDRAQVTARILNDVMQAEKAV